MKGKAKYRQQRRQDDRAQLVFDDAQGMHQQHPDTFEVDSIAELRESVQPGVYAKVCIRTDWTDPKTGQGPKAERIWTQVIDVDGVKVVAKLANTPVFFDREFGDVVEYELRHIYSVTEDDDES